MPVSDADLELLEAHLDGELSSAEDAALRVRLLADPALAAELSTLRADRSIRVEVVESLEPSDAAVRNLVLNVRKQITRDAVHADRMRIFRYVAATAACILFSFSAGWLGKEHAIVPNGANQPDQVAEHTNSGSPNADPQMPVENVGLGSLAQSSPGSIDFGGPQPANGLGNVLGSAALGSDAPPTAYQVNLTDPFGHVLAVQRFKTLEQAREFSEDVGQLQRQRQQNPIAEPVVYKDQF